MNTQIRTIRFEPKPAQQYDIVRGEAGEVVLDRTNNTLRIFNGQTLGGTQLATKNWVADQIAAIDYDLLNDLPTDLSQFTNGPDFAAKSYVTTAASGAVTTANGYTDAEISASFAAAFQVISFSGSTITSTAAKITIDKDVEIPTQLQVGKLLIYDNNAIRVEDPNPLVPLIVNSPAQLDGTLNVLGTTTVENVTVNQTLSVTEDIVLTGVITLGTEPSQPNHAVRQQDLRAAQLANIAFSLAFGY